MVRLSDDSVHPPWWSWFTSSFTGNEQDRAARALVAASAAAAAAHSRGGRVRLGCLDPKAKRFAKIEQPDKGDCVLFFHAVAKGGVDDGFDLLRFIRRLGDNGWMATAGITREQVGSLCSVSASCASCVLHGVLHRIAASASVTVIGRSLCAGDPCACRVDSDAAIRGRQEARVR